MSPDVAGSPARPRKITLADFIHEKRVNPSVNLSLRSRTLTPQSHVTSVNGSTNEVETKSSNTDKPISTTSNRRDSSRTYSSEEEEEEEEDVDGKEKGGKTSRRKRAVFACDGHGKRESSWKLESIRRIRLGNLIQKSRESSAKTAEASELDLFNDSRSGYSFDIMSRQSTRHPPHSRESKWSRRDRRSRGDNRHTTHSYRGSDMHRSAQKGTQTMGESRGCQTSPTLHHKIVDRKPVMEEVKSQPITEVDDEFDYPLSQLILEYPYNPNSKETETKTTESATETLPTDIHEGQRSQTIDIDLPSTNDGGKHIYDANGTIIIVTASPRIDPGDMVNRTNISDNYQSIVVPEQEKLDSSSETKDQGNVNDKLISNDPITHNTNSQSRNQSENTSETHEPADDLDDNDHISTSSTNNQSKSDAVLSLGTAEDKAPASQVYSLYPEHVDEGTGQMDEDGNMISNSTVELGKDKERSIASEANIESGEVIRHVDECGNMTFHGTVAPGMDNGRSAVNESSVETSSYMNLKVEPTPEKDVAVQQPHDSGEQLQEKDIVEKDKNAELLREEIPNAKTISPTKINDELSPEKNASVEASLNKDNDVKVPDKDLRDEASLGNEMGAEQSEINTSDEGWQLAKPETHKNDVKKEQQTIGSGDTERQKREVNMEKKAQAKNNNGHDKSLLDACKREISDEVQLGKAVLKVIQMWKDSAVVRSIKNQDRATSSAIEDKTTKKGKSLSSDQWPSKSSELDRTSRAKVTTGGERPSNGKDDQNNSLKKTQSSQPKQIQIVIRNPVRNGNSNKESSVKIVIKLPSEYQQNSNASTADVTEKEESKPNNDTEETNHQQDVKVSEVPKEEPQEVPSQESQEIPNKEPQEVPIPKEEINDTRVPLPPIPKLVPNESDRHFKRLSHKTSGKQRSPLISLRQATVTTASIRMREVDGVFCSNRGVYIGHDRKLYNTFQDASETSRVDQILENFNEMRNGNIEKDEFLYDETNDEVFQTHLDSFRRGNSNKSKVTGSVVLATSKLYSQARTRKARAYSILHKKLTSAVNY